MSNTMNINKRNDKTLQQAYAPYNVRKAMKADQRNEVREAYIAYTKANKADDGRRGKTFEVRLRHAINPNSATLKCQKQGLADLPIYINKQRCKIECKTGGGDIVNNIWLEDWKSETDLENQLNFDYIAYIMTYTDTEVDLWEKAIIMTKKAFITWLSGYNGLETGLLTYKKNEGRLMIANPKASKKRCEYIENLPEYAKNNSECYNLSEFMVLTGRGA